MQNEWICQGLGAVGQQGAETLLPLARDKERGRRREERQSVEVRVGTLKPAYMTERKKADMCACRSLHGSEVESSCSSRVQIVRVGLILKEQNANSFGKVKKVLVRIFE